MGGHDARDRLPHRGRRPGPVSTQPRLPFGGAARSGPSGQGAGWPDSGCGPGRFGHHRRRPGALEVIEEAGGLGPVDLVGACDVSVGFVEAASRFGPQKGADPGQVAALQRRLEGVADQYRRAYGVDVLTVPGAGAAGGFGGAIVALGGRLRSGYAVVSELVALPAALRASRTVVTGEGALDASSLMGKVVGSVVSDASAGGIPVLVIAGRADDEAVRAAETAGARVVSLSDAYGEERALNDTAGCIALAVRDTLPAAEPPTGESKAGRWSEGDGG